MAALFALATAVAWLTAGSGEPGVLAGAGVPAASPGGGKGVGAAGVALHPVRVRRPVESPRVDTGLVDGRGRPVTTGCGVCHATSKPRLETVSGGQLDEFHQGLVYRHGGLACLSCHHAGNYDRLRLADGRELEFPEALRLCAQCHGPQYRDYLHGSHGGMTGYWDLERGPRDRNHCVDCHDPHAPAFPVVRPVFAPVPDRGLASPRGGKSSSIHP